MMAVCFTINGQMHRVTPDHILIGTTLGSFIRNHAHLSGTKLMCRQGECGACMVNISGIHPVTGNMRSLAINSCLQPIYACHGMDIVTIEGIGSKTAGYHPIQQRLAHFNGTQCGMCSPGMVMTMYGLMESALSDKAGITMEQIEESFAGNVCRCTGYRPIMDAFKTFASDASDALIKGCQDIEDLGTKCGQRRDNCSVKCSRRVEKKPVHLTFEEDQEWHKVYNVDEIFDVLKQIGCKAYEFVAGNTAHALYSQSEKTQVLIDIKSVEELQTYWIGKDLIIGANVSLSEFIDILKEAARSEKKFKYCEQLASHVAKIAHVAVRNVGTVAGNLCLKNQHLEFPSDLHVILEAAGAQITIMQSEGQIVTASPVQLSRKDMNKKLILNITLPPVHADNYAFRTYRVETRAQNGRPFINGAFLMQLCARQQNIESASVCFGGINPTFTHAIETEKVLLGKSPFRNETLQQAMATLELDLKPSLDARLADAGYRKQVAMGIFYKFMLDVAPRKTVDPEYKTGRYMLERPLSSGSQSFETFLQHWPLTRNIPKLEALVQTSGEAAYINDMPKLANELFAAFVIATRPRTIIKHIDVTNAMKAPGVVKFLSASNIPGMNDFTPFNKNAKHYFPFSTEAEEVFCSGKVLFYGQPVGIILAETFEQANHASDLVQIEYSSTDGVILPTVQHVLKANAQDRITSVNAAQVGPHYITAADAQFKLAGQLSMEGQYHYTMETQTCICIPKEDGLDVLCSTQYPDIVQVTVGQVLNIPHSRINVITRRIGGAYGSKITRSSQIAAACALGAHVTQRPVRFVLSIESNMTSIGKRKGCVNNYEASVRSDGKIIQLTNTYIYDCGAHLNDPCEQFYNAYFANCYNNQAWKLVPKQARTDAPTNTWLRAPGSAEAIATSETVMEHIAFELGLDPFDVRMANLAKDSKMYELLPQFRKDVDFDSRLQTITHSNESNRWKKRGISVVPLAYPIKFFGGMRAWLSVYHVDGSVSICHSGVEMGQGINTKAAQVASHALGIPLEKISVKPHHSLLTANSFVSAGSLATDHVALAVLRSCQILLERIRPVREQNPSASWEVLVNTCFTLNIDLTASYWSTEAEHPSYTVWALACSEIELDVLTGNVRIPRVDILEDTGESLSPGIDIGQIEGAFVMGVGYYLNESLQYDSKTGALLNCRALTYKPPGPKDIPTDFRIKLLQNTGSSGAGVLRSKATGEPAYNLAISVVFALRQAIMSARKDAGLRTEWISLGAPSTPDRILQLMGNSVEQYLLTAHRKDEQEK